MLQQLDFFQHPLQPKLLFESYLLGELVLKHFNEGRIMYVLILKKKEDKI